MQPAARSDFRMALTAQRLHRARPIPNGRCRKPAAGVRIPRTAEVNEPDPAEKARRKAILGLAGYQEHRAGTVGRCHWKQESLAGLERVEP
jgi:hypothetical protein